MWPGPVGIPGRAWLGGSHGLWRVRGYSAELGSLAAMGCGECEDTVLSLARGRLWTRDYTASTALTFVCSQGPDVYGVGSAQVGIPGIVICWVAL